MKTVASRLSAAALPLAAVFCVAVQILTAFLLMRAWQNPHWYFTGTRLDLTDFSQFYQCGQLIVGPHAHRVYDPDTQIWWSLGLIYPHIPVKGHFYNQSVPFLYLFCIPYGKLPYHIAYVVWCLSTGLAALLSQLLLFRVSLRDSASGGRLTALCLLLGFASIPAYLTVWHGQTTFILLTAMSLAMAALLSGRDIAAGIALALSTVKPQYILLPLAAMAGLERWRLLIALFTTELLLFALAGLLMGFENIIGYPRILINAESSTRFAGVNPHVMASMRGLLSVILPHKTAMLVTVLALFASLLPLALTGRRLATGANSIKGRLYLAFTFTLALVLSPHSHYFDCLLLLVPAALLAPAMLESATGETALLRHNKWYRYWCVAMAAYAPLSWVYNFALGSMEAEGVAFLAHDTLMAVLLALATRDHLRGK